MINARLLLLLPFLLLLLFVPGCGKFRIRSQPDSSPITVSDDRVHVHNRYDFAADNKTITTKHQSDYVAAAMVVHNYCISPCPVPLSGKSWSADLLDADGNPIDTLNGPAGGEVTVTDVTGDSGFVHEGDDGHGPGYYHDPPLSGGGAVTIKSVKVTVNGKTTTLLCPPTNCTLVVQYCKDGIPDGSNEWKCK